MTVTLKHTITGIVQDYPDHIADLPFFKDVLVPTDEEAFCTDCEIPTPAKAASVPEKTVETAPDLDDYFDEDAAFDEDDLRD